MEFLSALKKAQELGLTKEEFLPIYMKDIQEKEEKLSQAGSESEFKFHSREAASPDQSNIADNVQQPQKRHFQQQHFQKPPSQVETQVYELKGSLDHARDFLSSQLQNFKYENTLQNEQLNGIQRENHNYLKEIYNDIQKLLQNLGVGSSDQALNTDKSDDKILSALLQKLEEIKLAVRQDIQQAMGGIFTEFSNQNSNQISARLMHTKRQEELFLMQGSLIQTNYQNLQQQYTAMTNTIRDLTALTAGVFNKTSEFQNIVCAEMQQQKQNQQMLLSNASNLCTLAFENKNMLQDLKDQMQPYDEEFDFENEFQDMEENEDPDSTHLSEQSVQDSADISKFEEDSEHYGVCNRDFYDEDLNVSFSSYAVCSGSLIFLTCNFCVRNMSSFLESRKELERVIYEEKLGCCLRAAIIFSGDKMMDTLDIILDMCQVGRDVSLPDLLRISTEMRLIDTSGVLSDLIIARENGVFHLPKIKDSGWFEVCAAFLDYRIPQASELIKRREILIQYRLAILSGQINRILNAEEVLCTNMNVDHSFSSENDSEEFFDVEENTDGLKSSLSLSTRSEVATELSTTSAVVTGVSTTLEMTTEVPTTSTVTTGISTVEVEVSTTSKLATEISTTSEVATEISVMSEVATEAPTTSEIAIEESTASGAADEVFKISEAAIEKSTSEMTNEVSTTSEEATEVSATSDVATREFATSEMVTEVLEAATENSNQTLPIKADERNLQVLSTAEESTVETSNLKVPLTVEYNLWSKLPLTEFNLQPIDEETKSTKESFLQEMLISQDSNLQPPLRAKESNLQKTLAAEESNLQKTLALQPPLTANQVNLQSTLTYEQLNLSPVLTEEDLNVKPLLTSEDLNVKPLFTSEDLNVKPLLTSEDLNFKPLLNSEDLNVKPLFTSEDLNFKPLLTSEDLNVKPLFTSEDLNFKPLLTSEDLNFKPSVTAEEINLRQTLKNEKFDLHRPTTVELNLQPTLKSEVLNPCLSSTVKELNQKPVVQVNESNQQPLVTKEESNEQIVSVSEESHQMSTLKSDESNQQSGLLDEKLNQQSTEELKQQSASVSGKSAQQPMLTAEKPNRQPLLTDEGSDHLPTLTNEGSNQLPTLTNEGSNQLPTLTDRESNHQLVLTPEVSDQQLMSISKESDKCMTLADEEFDQQSPATEEEFNLQTPMIAEELDLPAPSVLEKLNLCQPLAFQKPLSNENEEHLVTFPYCTYFLPVSGFSSLVGSKSLIDSPDWYLQFLGHSIHAVLVFSDDDTMMVCIDYFHGYCDENMPEFSLFKCRVSLLDETDQMEDWIIGERMEVFDITRDSASDWMDNCVCTVSCNMIEDRFLVSDRTVFRFDFFEME